MEKCLGSNCVLQKQKRQWGHLKQPSKAKKPIGAAQKRFPCSVCEKSYNTPSHLSQHMQLHTGRYSYYCDPCRRGFNAATNYKRHMDKHQGVRYHCEICGKVFTTKDSQQRHRRGHQNQWIFPNFHIKTSWFVVQCLFLVNPLLTHLSVNTVLLFGSKVTYRVSFCFFQNLKFQTWLVIHVWGIFCVIHLCVGLFVKKKAENGGQKESKGDVKKRFACGLCEKSYNRKTHLKQHMDGTSHWKVQLQLHHLSTRI